MAKMVHFMHVLPQLKKWLVSLSAQMHSLLNGIGQHYTLWGRLDNGRKRHPGPNPRNLWVPPYVGKMALADGIQLWMLGWVDNPGWFGWALMTSHMPLGEEGGGAFGRREKKAV